MKTKFNAYNKTLDEFINDIYVVCPNCEKQAIVKTKGLNKERSEDEIRLICISCGSNKMYSEVPMDEWISEKSQITYKVRHWIIGAGIDPYFKLPLWLQKELSNGVLWAYNYEHLSFIENHVKAELRFRDAALNHNRSLGAKLPKWMTSKKNRAEVLSGIEKLKKK